MAGSNILTSKQFEKLINDQLIKCTMTMQNNMINKQTELTNDEKEFKEKLSIIGSKFDELKDTLKAYHWSLFVNTMLVVWNAATWDKFLTDLGHFYKKKKKIPAAKKNSFAQTKLGTFLFKKNVATIKKSRNDKKLQKIKK